MPQTASTTACATTYREAAPGERAAIRKPPSRSASCAFRNGNEAQHGRMLKEQVSRWLSQRIAAYVDEIEPQQLKVELWYGRAELRDVQLRRGTVVLSTLPTGNGAVAVASLSAGAALSVVVDSGSVGRLSISIPWNRPRREPPCVVIEDVEVDLSVVVEAGGHYETRTTCVGDADESVEREKPNHGSDALASCAPSEARSPRKEGRERITSSEQRQRQALEDDPASLSAYLLEQLILFTSRSSITLRNAMVRLHFPTDASAGAEGARSQQPSRAAGKPGAERVLTLRLGELSVFTPDASTATDTQSTPMHEMLASAGCIRQDGTWGEAAAGELVKCLRLHDLSVQYGDHHVMQPLRGTCVLQTNLNDVPVLFIAVDIERWNVQVPADVVRDAMALVTRPPQHQNATARGDEHSDLSVRDSAHPPFPLTSAAEHDAVDAVSPGTLRAYWRRLCLGAFSVEWLWHVGAFDMDVRWPCETGSGSGRERFVQTQLRLELRDLDGDGGLTDGRQLQRFSVCMGRTTLSSDPAPDSESDTAVAPRWPLLLSARYLRLYGRWETETDAAIWHQEVSVEGAALWALQPRREILGVQQCAFESTYSNDPRHRLTLASVVLDWDVEVLAAIAERLKWLRGLKSAAPQPAAAAVPTAKQPVAVSHRGHSEVRVRRLRLRWGCDGTTILCAELDDIAAGVMPEAENGRSNAVSYHVSIEDMRVADARDRSVLGFDTNDGRPGEPLRSALRLHWVSSSPSSSTTTTTMTTNRQTASARVGVHRPRLTLRDDWVTSVLHAAAQTRAAWRSLQIYVPETPVADKPATDAAAPAVSLSLTDGVLSVVSDERENMLCVSVRDVHCENVSAVSARFELVAVQAQVAPGPASTAAARYITSTFDASLSLPPSGDIAVQVDTLQGFTADDDLSVVMQVVGWLNRASYLAADLSAAALRADAPSDRSSSPSRDAPPLHGGMSLHCQRFFFAWLQSAETAASHAPPAAPATRRRRTLMDVCASPLQVAYRYEGRAEHTRIDARQVRLLTDESSYGFAGTFWHSAALRIDLDTDYETHFDVTVDIARTSALVDVPMVRALMGEIGAVQWAPTPPATTVPGSHHHDGQPPPPADYPVRTDIRVEAPSVLLYPLGRLPDEEALAVLSVCLGGRVCFDGSGAWPSRIHVPQALINFTALPVDADGQLAAFRREPLPMFSSVKEVLAAAEGDASPPHLVVRELLVVERPDWRGLRAERHRCLSLQQWAMQISAAELAAWVAWHRKSVSKEVDGGAGDCAPAEVTTDTSAEPAAGGWLPGRVSVALQEASLTLLDAWREPSLAMVLQASAAMTQATDAGALRASLSLQAHVEVHGERLLERTRVQVEYERRMGGAGDELRRRERRVRVDVDEPLAVNITPRMLLRVGELRNRLQQADMVHQPLRHWLQRRHPLFHGRSPSMWSSWRGRTELQRTISVRVWNGLGITVRIDEPSVLPPASHRRCRLVLDSDSTLRVRLQPEGCAEREVQLGASTHYDLQSRATLASWPQLCAVLLWQRRDADGDQLFLLSPLLLRNRTDIDLDGCVDLADGSRIDLGTLPGGGNREREGDGMGRRTDTALYLPAAFAFRDDCTLRMRPRQGRFAWSRVAATRSARRSRRPRAGSQLRAQWRQLLNDANGRQRPEQAATASATTTRWSTAPSDSRRVQSDPSCRAMWRAALGDGQTWVYTCAGRRCPQPTVSLLVRAAGDGAGLLDALQVEAPLTVRNGLFAVLRLGDPQRRLSPGQTCGLCEYDVMRDFVLPISLDGADGAPPAGVPLRVPATSMRQRLARRTPREAIDDAVDAEDAVWMVALPTAAVTVSRRLVLSAAPLIVEAVLTLQVDGALSVVLYPQYVLMNAVAPDTELAFRASVAPVATRETSRRARSPSRDPTRRRLRCLQQHADEPERFGADDGIDIAASIPGMQWMAEWVGASPPQSHSSSGTVSTRENRAPSGAHTTAVLVAPYATPLMTCFPSAWPPLPLSPHHLAVRLHESPWSDAFRVDAPNGSQVVAVMAPAVRTPASPRAPSVSRSVNGTRWNEWWWWARLIKSLGGISLADGMPRRDRRQYELVAAVRPAPPPFHRTRAVVLHPRLTVVNLIPQSRILLKQAGVSVASETELQALEYRQPVPFVWSDAHRPKLLHLRLDELGWAWSGGVRYDRDREVWVRLRNALTGACYLLRLHFAYGTDDAAEVVQACILPPHPFLVPYAVVNRTIEPVRFRQSYAPALAPYDTVRPLSQTDYAWDEPFGVRRLEVEVVGYGRLGSFALEPDGAEVLAQVPLRRQVALTEVADSGGHERAGGIRQFVVRREHRSPKVCLVVEEAVGDDEVEADRAGHTDMARRSTAGVDVRVEVGIQLRQVALALLDDDATEVLLGSVRGVQCRAYWERLAVAAEEALSCQRMRGGLQLTVAAVQLDASRAMAGVNGARSASPRYGVLLAVCPEAAPEPARQVAAATTSLGEAAPIAALSLQLHGERQCTDQHVFWCLHTGDMGVYPVSLNVDTAVVADVLPTCERLLRALQRPPGDRLPPGVPETDDRGVEREKMASIDTAGAEAMRTLLYASIPSLDQAQALVWRTARLFLERLQCRPVHVALSLRTDVASLQTLLRSNNNDNDNGSTFTHRRAVWVTYLANAEDAYLTFRGIELRGAFASLDECVGSLRRHYQRQWMGKALQVVGSADLLGNPALYVRQLLHSTLSMTRDVRRELQKPDADMVGIAVRVSGYVGALSGATLDALAKMLRSLEAALAQSAPLRLAVDASSVTWRRDASQSRVLWSSAWRAPLSLARVGWQHQRVRGVLEGLVSGTVAVGLAALATSVGVLAYAAERLRDALGVPLELGGAALQPVRPLRERSLDGRVHAYTSEQPLLGRQVWAQLARQTMLPSTEAYVYYTTYRWGCGMLLTTHRVAVMAEVSDGSEWQLRWQTRLDEMLSVFVDEEDARILHLVTLEPAVRMAGGSAEMVQGETRGERHASYLGGLLTRHPRRHSSLTLSPSAARTPRGKPEVGGGGGGARSPWSTPASPERRATARALFGSTPRHRPPLIYRLQALEVRALEAFVTRPARYLTSSIRTVSAELSAELRDILAMQLRDAPQCAWRLVHT